MLEPIPFAGYVEIDEMNNEPVAWIEPDVIPLTHIIKAVVRREQDEQYSIPLYTHPATAPMLVLDGNRVYPVIKDLTDEEILEFAKEQYGHAVGLYNHIGFARAIMKRCGIISGTDK